MLAHRFQRLPDLPASPMQENDHTIDHSHGRITRSTSNKCKQEVYANLGHEPLPNRVGLFEGQVVLQQSAPKRRRGVETQREALVTLGGTSASSECFPSMRESLPILIEEAIQIAWDYLEKTGQIDDPEIASWLLLDTVEHMVRCGEGRRLALSNGAIEAYERLRADSLVA
jgi:hypothetical protein